MFFLVFYSALQGVEIPVPAHYYEPDRKMIGHPGYDPFISHLTFRKVADHIIDQNTASFDPSLVQCGDLIYLNVWYLHWFVNQVHDLIAHPYILCSCDVGSWLPDPVLQKLLYDPKCAAWFCRNIIFSYHPKLFQIPMGPNIALMIAACDPEEFFVTFPERPFFKKHLLYMNHYPRTFGQRDLIVKQFEDAPYCLSKNRSDRPYQGMSRDLFYQDLAASYFTFSPVGLETDCLRTWEALMFQCIPIVEHTFLDPLYEDLPIVIVHDWSEVTQPFLEKKMSDLGTAKWDKAYFTYWKDLIRETQRKVKMHDVAFSQVEATRFTAQDLEDLSEILSEYDYLVYKGFLAAARPFQLADSCPNLLRMYLYDPWLSRDTFESFDRYITDPFLQYQFDSNKEKIALLHFDMTYDLLHKNFYSILYQIPRSYAVFLDLTYYRNSLLTNFQRDFQEFHHLMQRNLTSLYRALPLFTLLCGNMGQDPFLTEVLERFSIENGIKIETKGSFWSVIKNLPSSTSD